MIKIPIRAVGVVKNVVRVDSTTPLFSTHFGHEGKELLVEAQGFNCNMIHLGEHAYFI